MFWSRNHLVLRTLLPDSVTILGSGRTAFRHGHPTVLSKRSFTMKRNFAMLAAAVTFAALPTFAFGADAIDEVPSAPEAPIEEVAAPSGWAGAYAGVSGGYAWGKASAPGTDFDSKGFNGGLYGGYNLQNGSIVYGAEADLGYSAADGDNGAGVAFKSGVNGAARARVGIALDPVLLYGAGGVAATQGKVTAGGLSDSQTHFGWTAGVGAEAKVTENVIGRLEFRHNAFGEKTYDIGAATPAKLTENEIRVGVGMKF
jgi:outer membrane immunogenic protein